MNVAIITLIFVVLLYVFFIRNKKSKNSRKRTKHGMYHCVSVCFDQTACSAIREYKGQRILSSEAPVLPLANCDTSDCNCHFQHHEERRQEDRRGVYNKAISDIVQNDMSITPRSADDRRK